MTNQPEERPLLENLRFTYGWLVLGVVGIAGLLMFTSFVSLILVSAIGICCSILAFRSLEMLLAMAAGTILGAMLITFTNWAWIAPWLPGGFMLTVTLDSLRGGSEL